MATFRKMYEEGLATKFVDSQFKRLAPGLYVSPIDALIWKGVTISLLHVRGALTVQPGLAIYCPAAYKVLRATFRSMGNRGFERAAQSQRMGVPIIVEPLYAVVNRRSPLRRSSLSYGVRWQDELESSLELLYEDFLATHDLFFGRVRNVSELIDQVEAYRATSAGINAMALSVVKDKDISTEELRNCAELCPSPMTARFLETLLGNLGNKTGRLLDQ